MPEITQEQHEERMWRMAKAEAECKACEGTGNVEEQAYPPGQAISTCGDCAGTGKVPLLPGVRVMSRPCWGKGYRNPCLGRNIEDANCPTCHGLGYVPSVDSMVWAGVLWPLIKAKVEKEPRSWEDTADYICALIMGNFPAALKAAARTLMAAEETPHA